MAANLFHHFVIPERLINGIADIKKALAYKFTRQSENTEEINQQIDQMAAVATGMPKFDYSFADFHIEYIFSSIIIVLQISKLPERQPILSTKFWRRSSRAIQRVAWKSYRATSRSPFSMNVSN